jgi:hypothetical protein
MFAACSACLLAYNEAVEEERALLHALLMIFFFAAVLHAVLVLSSYISAALLFVQVPVYLFKHACIRALTEAVEEARALLHALLIWAFFFLSRYDVDDAGLLDDLPVSYLSKARVKRAVKLLCKLPPPLLCCLIQRTHAYMLK